MAPILMPGSTPSLTPALPPPPGVTSNFADPDSRAPAALTAIGIITPVMLLFVLARFFAKLVYARSQLGWEDISCGIGTILSVAQSGMTIWLFRSGFGAHIWDITLDEYHDKAYKIVEVLKTTSTLYNLALLFTKLSILLLFFRLFRIVRRARIWIYIGVAIILALHVTGAVLSFTAGAPSTDKPSNSSSTNDKNYIGINITAINVASDIYILILPIIEVSRLQLYQGQRLRVLAVFSTGLLACIASAVGLVLRFVYWPYPDMTWNAGPWMVTAIYEMDIGLIVGCMPILPLITKHSDRVKHFVLMFRSFLSSGPNRPKYHFDWTKRASYSSDAQRLGSFPDEVTKTSTKNDIPLQSRNSSIDPQSLNSGSSRASRVGNCPV